MSSNRRIDLRSDTFTLPDAAMRAAMAAAQVGDDVYGEDPSVRELEERTAEILGKKAAVFMPSGTMSNQIGLRIHTQKGDQALVEATAHMFLLEGGSPAAISGVTMRQLPGEKGILSAKQVREAIPSPHPLMVSTVLSPVTLLCLENTHNLAGGTVWPIEEIDATTAEARRLGLAIHLDGARLWNASVASGVPEAEYARHFDTVSVCFSKGLGAPVGSALAGSETLMSEARRFRQNLGGGMRQAGIVAAGALHALMHQRERLHQDHANAIRLAEGLAQMPKVTVDIDTVQTNIVCFQVSGITAGEFADRCFEADMLMIPSGEKSVRAVTWKGVSREDVDRALAIIEASLATSIRQ